MCQIKRYHINKTGEYQLIQTNSLSQKMKKSSFLLISYLDVSRGKENVNISNVPDGAKF